MIVASINSLYGTKYAAFDEVSVPNGEGKTIGEYRAYYDWCNFNAQHFADWFRWMNGIVKDVHSSHLHTSESVRRCLGCRLFDGRH